MEADPEMDCGPLLAPFYLPQGLVKWEAELETIMVRTLGSSIELSSTTPQVSELSEGSHNSCKRPCPHFAGQNCEQKIAEF